MTQRIYVDRKTGELVYHGVTNDTQLPWCECERTGSLDWHFHPDGERGALIGKHHYTCNKCHRITQIG